MATQAFDVVVVGTGPGGYVAAIRCAQLGLTVAAVEDDRPGGVCLNWGCIPTKALLRNAEVVGLFERAEEFGITVGEWRADYAQAIQRSRRVADRMAKGVEFLFRKNKITLVAGAGTLKSKNVVEVKGKEGIQTLEAKRAVILATGSEPKSLPGVAIDETQVISSNGAVRAEAKPASLIVIGAGAVGMEFADVYRAYGVEVTVLEALPRVLPVEDEEASAQIARLFTRRGVTVRTGVKVVKVAPGKGSVAVDIDADGKRETLTAAQVLMAVGRGARTKGLGLEALGVAMDRGLVTAGPTMETSVKGTVDYGNVPSCTYCRPQVASIGLSEAAAKADGREVSVGRFPFTANGKAVALGETEGFLKVVADKRTGEILGVHIVGPEATELIHEFAVGRTLEATLEEIIHTIHAHPTLSEASLEATLAALGQAIHI